MLPFQLTVNGKVHLIQQQVFKDALVDCPNHIVSRQLELGHGIMAVTNAHFSVLVPIAVDVHKYIFARTKTQTHKVAEIAVLLGEKEKEEDLFSLKENKDLLNARKEIEELKAKLEGLNPELLEDKNTEELTPQDPDVPAEQDTFVHSEDDLKDPELDDSLTDYVYDDFEEAGKKVITRDALVTLLVDVLVLDEDAEKEIKSLHKDQVLSLYNEICDEVLVEEE